jgi:hypothetical protein
MGMILLLQRVSETEVNQLEQSPELVENLISEQAGGKTTLSLEKSWHGLHFVLTGSAFSEEGPLAFLLVGGTPTGDDLGYGPARLFKPGEVAQIANALGGLSAEEFDRRFDLEKMTTEDLYPQIWDEPREDLLEEYGSYFEQLKQFVHVGAREQQGLLIFLR